MARPTKYKPTYNKQAYKMCLLSATDKQMADFFEVSEATINTWKKEYPTFLESLKKGKIKADAEVAKSLYQRACGYKHAEDKIFHNPGAKKKKDRIVIVPTIKHYPPDTAAAFIWLKNRAGWRDKQETELKLSKETASLLGLIDGETKGKLPTTQEVEDV